MIDQSSLHFRDICKHFGKTRVLDGSALTLRGHQCIVITGENGAGKTTLLRIIAGLEKPDRCQISIDDGEVQSWRRLRRRLQKAVMYLHQQPYMLAGSLRRNLEYAARLNPAIVDRASAVARSLAWAGLEDLEKQSAASLSGGQKQRVALARARLRGPQVLLLDEPTANLDTDSRGRTLQMLQEFRDSGTAIVIVSHDPEVFGELITAHLHLQNGRIQPQADGRSDVVELDAVRQSHKR